MAASGGFGTSPLELMATDAMLRGEAFLQNFTYQSSWITGQASALGANATVDQQIQINQDSDFVVQGFGLTALSGAGVFVIPDLTLNIVIAGSGRQIMSAPVHVCNFTCPMQTGINGTPIVAGALANGPVISMPLLIAANSTLTTTLANRTGTAWNYVQLALLGFKVFYTGGNRQQIFHTL